MVTHDLLVAALPTLAALVGVLLNRQGEMRLDARITSLENRFHSDMLQVIGKLTELEVRVARLEEKQAK